MRYLVTGCAGFIGSHLAERLLSDGHYVTGIDDLSTGTTENMRTFYNNDKFVFIKSRVGDAVFIDGYDVVFHQAAVGSIPRSIENPLGTLENNVTEFIRFLDNCRIAGVKRFVYASSSSVYQETEKLSCEADLIQPTNPYSASKICNEVIAESFQKTYGMETIALRYFNVFGPRQDPNSAYSAVIPKWITKMLKKEPIYINGNGKQTRDFTSVNDVVKANLQAARRNIPNPYSYPNIFNVSGGNRISINQLFETLTEIIGYDSTPIFLPPKLERKRSGANLKTSRTFLGYKPSDNFFEDLSQTVEYYRAKL